MGRHNSTSGYTIEEKGKRVWVDPETHKRISKYAIDRGISIKEAYREIITGILDENGKISGFEGNTIEIELTEETYEILRPLMQEFNEPADKIIQRILLAFRVLYSEELRFSDALKPLPELIKILALRAKK